jgi:hypothetical protein
MNAELPQFVCDMLGTAPKRGEGLNLWLFRTSRVLHAFRTEPEIFALLEAMTAGEPLQKGEIDRAIARSRSCAYQPGQPSHYVASAWPKLDQDKRKAVAAAGGGLADLWEASPVRFDNNVCRTERIIDALFPGDPLLCVGQSHSHFWTRSREELRGKLRRLALIVPSTMLARTGRTQEGEISAHTLESTGPRRFLIVEQDRGTIDAQAATLLHLAERAPLVLAVHSGGKSVHGWFACRNEAESTIRNFFEYAVTLGADPALWTRSQFARMPDGRRDDGARQTTYFFNPDAIR